MAGLALGASTALAMAMQGNDQLGQILARYLEPDTYANWSAALTAPFVEEAAKAMCAAVVLVLCASVFNRISHALLVGMFVGFGFDIAEDLTYATSEAIGSLDSDTSGAGGSLLVRALTAVPAHWAYTGLAAVGVLLLLPTFRNDVGWSRLRRIAVAVALFVGASLMHFVWDGPVPSVWWKFAVNIGIFVTAVLVLLRYERRRVVDRIDAGRAAMPLAEVDAAVLDSLPTGRRRRSLRKQARRTGGRAAKRAVAAQQRWALDRIASDEVCAHSSVSKCETLRMQIGIPRESHAGETRVAATPQTVGAAPQTGLLRRRRVRRGRCLQLLRRRLRRGRRRASAIPWACADVVLKVNAPDDAEIAALTDDATLVSLISPALNPELVEKLSARPITVLAMDAVPRISRAQSLDVLSSMANIAGYRAVVEAAHAFGRFFTGQVTAAGKVPPAKVLVVGAGVAGLAAIGAAGSMGAIVRATDPRPEVADQVKSLGGEYLYVDKEAAEVSATGYAKEMGDDYKAREAALYAEQAARRRHHHHHRADPRPARAPHHHRRDGRLDEVRAA